jgi:hypothetical protein
MTHIIEKEQLILKKFQQLSPEKQQELIDFAENLADQQEKKSLSAYEVAKEFAGCVDFGPGDLSTNKNYLKGLEKK